jgi:hypothetical protein
VVERGGAIRFRPGEGVVDLRGASWEVEGEIGVLEASVDDGKLRSETYPDPLARVFSALAAPHSGDFVLSLADGFEAVDWGGVTHQGGGSHGALHAGDSLGPLLFVGCGPDSADEKEQWTLRDVAPVVWTTGRRDWPAVRWGRPAGVPPRPAPCQRRSNVFGSCSCFPGPGAAEVGVKRAGGRDRRSRRGGERGADRRPPSTATGRWPLSDDDVWSGRRRPGDGLVPSPDGHQA